MGMRRNWMLLVLAAAACWHLISLADHWREAQRVGGGNDFASYYYAARAGWEGADPYDKAQLGLGARDDETRRGVHPYFYPPPFLLGMLWTLPLELNTAYRLWFWLDELMGLGCVLVLWRWWGPLGPTIGPTLLVSGALLTAVPNNHVMGQANLPVLLLVLLALRQQERGRELSAGALMGAACMAKMSPALFVAWWLLHRHWRPAVAACGWAVVYSALSLIVVGFGWQLRFYTEVLPGFSDGSYNGLTVGIDLFGNHSIPSLFDDLWPSSERGHLILSGAAQRWTTLTVLVMVGACGWTFRRPASDDLQRAAQVATIGALMLLIPVITYEHHLVWLLPAAVVVVVAMDRGRLRGWEVVLVGGALAVWCVDLATLKGLWGALKPGWPALALVVRELKMLAIAVLFGVCWRIGRSA